MNPTMTFQRFRQCEGCFRPERKRLGSLQSKDDYECYGESYVKCFWGLCDQQKTTEAFAIKSEGEVVTHQPRRQLMPYHSDLVKKL